jgi:hypothetical protein
MADIECQDSPFLTNKQLDILKSHLPQKEVNTNADIDAVRILGKPCSLGVLRGGSFEVILHTQPWADNSNMRNQLAKPGYYGMKELDGGHAMPFLTYGCYNVFLFWMREKHGDSHEIQRLTKDQMKEVCCNIFPTWLKSIKEPERSRMLETQETISIKRTKRISSKAWMMLVETFPSVWKERKVYFSDSIKALEDPRLLIVDFGQKEGIQSDHNLKKDATKLKTSFDEAQIEQMWISVAYSNW